MFKIVKADGKFDFTMCSRAMNAKAGIRSLSEHPPSGGGGAVQRWARRDPNGEFVYLVFRSQNYAAHALTITYFSAAYLQNFCICFRIFAPTNYYFDDYEIKLAYSHTIVQFSFWGSTQRSSKFKL